MELILVVGTLGLLVVGGAAALGPKLRLPPPLVLVLLGIGVSLLPFVPEVRVSSDLVLIGILPPLLYSTSVALPTMDLRREFGTVSVLSVVLVVATALVLGLVFTLLIPGLPYALGVALGAVISPTDAVATSIVKGTGVSHRVTAILEGESLLNDASALVLLRTAIAGVGAAVSIPGTIAEFLYAVVVAAAIGFVVGKLAVAVGSLRTEAAVGTVLSFTVPFVASLPAEAAGASGLVAAVTAGLVVGRNAPYRIAPLQRIANAQNWRTISLALEGAVFLLMGLEITALVSDAGGASQAWLALGFGAVALLVVLALRTAFVVPALIAIAGRAKRGDDTRARLARVQEAIDDPAPDPRRRPIRDRDRARFQKRVNMVLADIDYLAASPLGPKEGAVVVWAGMRGAVTVAAAQVLSPGGADPDRALLVLIAFATAALSLLLQGGTLALLIRALRPAGDDPAAIEEERSRILAVVRETADAVPETAGQTPKQRRLLQLRASRAALLEARDSGRYDSELLSAALTTVDASEVALELQGGPQG